MATKKNLTFDSSLSVPQLKAVQGVDTLTISKGKEDGSRLFTCGAVRGPVSRTFDSKEDYIVSNVTDIDSGETFQLLHNRVIGEVLETL